MAFSTRSVPSTSQHIPAWKKLGLKLKSARDPPIHSEDHSLDDANSKKRKLADDEIGATEVESVKPHRPKHAKAKSSPAPPLPVKDLPEASLAKDDSNGANASSLPLATPLKKRKSVAFTPETKLEDGDSTKQLFYAWIAEQLAKDSSFNPQALGGAFKTLEPRSIPASATEEKAKKPKSKKKEKSLQKTDKQTIPTALSAAQEAAVHPAAIYIQQYHDSRSSWKFNKARQTYILKHLFDIDKLPSSLDLALTAYIEGLQGADARIRVKKAAEDIRDGDEKAKQAVAKENMEDPVRQQEYYDSALRQYKAQLKGQVKEQLDVAKELKPEWELKFLKRKRAERILWSMGDTLDVTDHVTPQQRVPLPSLDRNGAEGESHKKLKTNDGTARRRRKRRTGVPDDDDSSSSSGSSSSSDDSSEGSSSAEGTSSESETSSASEEGTTNSESSSSSSTSSSSSSSGDSSKLADSNQECSDSEGSSNSD